MSQSRAGHASTAHVRQSDPCGVSSIAEVLDDADSEPIATNGALPTLAEEDTSAEDEEDEEDVPDVDERINKDSTMSKKEMQDERDQLHSLIRETGFMFLDEELPADTETQRNTLHNALMYQMTDEQLKQIDPNYMSDTEVEYQLRSPAISAVSSASSYEQPNGVPPTMRLSESCDPVVSSSSSSTFKRGVTLDTFTTENNLGKYQITLNAKQHGWVFREGGRTVVCTYEYKVDGSSSEMSLHALEWTLRELVSDYDTLVLFSVLDPDDTEVYSTKQYRQRAQELMDKAIKMTSNEKVRIMLEFKVGNVRYHVNRALREYRPDFMIVGASDEKTGLRGLVAPKSMSKFFLQYAQVPVIIVNQLYDPERLPNYDPKSTPLERLYNYDDREDSNALSPVSSLEQRRPRFLRVVNRGRSVSASSTGSHSPSRTISPLRFLRRYL